MGSGQDENEQIYDKFFEVPAGGGFFKITLSEPLAGQQLRSGESYLWQISLIPDPDNRSSDRYAYGELVHTQPASTVALPSEASHPDPLIRAKALESAGFWQAAALTLYEAVQSPSLSAAERNQAEASWAALLTRLELGDLAEAELQSELRETQTAQR